MNNNIKSNFKKLVKGLLVSSVALVVLAGCGNKNGNTDQPLNAYTQSCINCIESGITGYPFFTAQTAAYQRTSYYGNNAAAARISWSFSGQNVSGANSSSSYNSGYYYSSPAMTYVGKVSVSGQLVNNAAIGINNFCPQIPAGSYTIATQSVGQWQNGQVSGLRLIISGANVNAVATINEARAYEYSNYGGYNSSSNSSQISGNLLIESVNGYYCQGLVLSLY